LENLKKFEFIENSFQKFEKWPLRIFNGQKSLNLELTENSFQKFEKWPLQVFKKWIDIKIWKMTVINK